LQIRDLTNQRFGSLTAVSRLGSKDGGSVWLCRCDCGREIEARSAILVRNKRRYCDWLNHLGEIVRRPRQGVEVGASFGDRVSIVMERLASGETPATLRRAGFRNTEIIRAKRYLAALARSPSSV
jgi:hypothetical protein